MTKMVTVKRKDFIENLFSWTKLNKLNHRYLQNISSAAFKNILKPLKRHAVPLGPESLQVCVISDHFWLQRLQSAWCRLRTRALIPPQIEGRLRPSTSRRSRHISGARPGFSPLRVTSKRRPLTLASVQYATVRAGLRSNPG